MHAALIVLALTNIITVTCLAARMGWINGILHWFAQGRRGEVIPFTCACTLAQAMLWFMTIITAKTAILIVVTCIASVIMWEKTEHA